MRIETQKLADARIHKKTTDCFSVLDWSGTFDAIFWEQKHDEGFNGEPSKTNDLILCQMSYHVLLWCIAIISNHKLLDAALLRFNLATKQLMQDAVRRSYPQLKACCKAVSLTVPFPTISI